ncbi:MAG: glycosyltransferase family 4 protein [Anaeromyxobacteraceae bacterium]
MRPDRLTGVERYALSLLAALARRAPGDIVLFTRPATPPALRALDVEQHASPFTRRVPTEQAWLPRAAREAGIELLHSLAFPTPVLWRGPAVITIHDATPWLYPETLSTGMRYYYRPLYAQALRRAAGVITVSNASRTDLLATLRLDPDHVHVTRNGVAPMFFGARTPDSARGRYLLAVGTLEPRKNLEALLDALRILRGEGRDLQLVLVGRRGWAEDLPLEGISPYVRLTGAIPDDELIELYAGAACFVLPSLYEGFGLSLAEAMAAGTPAVASDIAALREVGGDTVRYAPPRDPARLAATIGKALDDREESAALAARARERARAFTWDGCAAQTLELYRALTARSGTPRRLAAP